MEKKGPLDMNLQGFGNMEVPSPISEQKTSIVSQLIPDLD